jgi:hypothetical protein
MDTYSFSFNFYSIRQLLNFHPGTIDDLFDSPPLQRIFLKHASKKVFQLLAWSKLKGFPVLFEVPILFEIIIDLRFCLLYIIRLETSAGKDSEQYKCRSEDISLFSIVRAHPIKNLGRTISFSIIFGDIMKVSQVYFLVYYVYKRLHFSISFNDANGYIFNQNLKMSSIRLMNLLKACNKLAEEVASPSLIINKDWFYCHFMLPHLH